MVLQEDKGGAPQPFDTGLPRVQSSDDVPRWLIVLGTVAACTLLVALLRYAIDLLGVVFLIILVGFSIRAVSDWLTEGEAVSGWALTAVFGGLVGTVLVGLWLFGSRDMTSGALEHGVPAPVVAFNDFLERHGWGQRVLVAGGGTSPAAPAEPATASSTSTPGANGTNARSSGTPASEPSSPPAAETSSEPAHPRKSEPRGGSSSSGEAEAATVRPSRAGESHARAEAVTQPATDPAPAPSTVVAEPVSVATSTSLSSSRSSSVVGTSVRFSAVVTAEDASVPVGVVVFYDGDRAIGTVPIRGSSASVTAVLVTLDLAIGDHEIAAEFHGSHGFLGSRSPSITQTVNRR